MTSNTKSAIPAILKKYRSEILPEWQAEQGDVSYSRSMNEGELREQCAAFINGLLKATESGEVNDITGDAWSDLRDFLAGISRSRALQGISAAETATFVFSFKKVLFERMRKEIGNDAAKLGEEMWHATVLLDKLGLFTMETHEKSREEIIGRQQQELMELSTPVVTLWDGILALPLIGTLDSSRTQVVMESLLQKIDETGSEVAIIDITGVPTVDTLVAQHLIKTVTAARLMGGECIISGIRPQIAQTMVHLGVNLGGVATKSNLKDALALALKRSGLKVVKEKVKAPPTDLEA